uniref:mavicyanin-like n=1 Tax=Erigeron canadensis TaxID=72917 RepID=UPI001CB8A6E1|nr:mavicyanin-like [Erigeron canadensis]
MARAMVKETLLSIVATAMLIQLALAVDHPVGGSGGWDTSTNLDSWASSQTFTVGDNLVFTFLPNHDVLEVSKDDYDSCTTSGPISNGALTPVTVSLTAAGSRYFICGTPGHCDRGMKVEIKTIAAAASGPPTSTPPSSSSPTTPVSTESPPSSEDKPAPPVTSGGKPVSDDEPAKPSPSSAAIEKISVVSMMGIGFLLVI